MTDRKKPGVAFWATVVVVVLLVAYSLSSGPALWLLYNVQVSETSARLITDPYMPLVWTVSHSQSASRALSWYQSLWIDFSKPSVNPRLWGQPVR